MDFIVLIFLGLVGPFALIFSLDWIGQKLFNVPEGDGYPMLVVVLVWGIGPVLGLLLIVQGKIQGIEAVLAGALYLAVLKYFWWDNLKNGKSVDQSKSIILAPNKSRHPPDKSGHVTADESYRRYLQFREDQLKPLSKELEKILEKNPEFDLTVSERNGILEYARDNSMPVENAYAAFLRNKKANQEAQMRFREEEQKRLEAEEQKRLEAEDVELHPNLTHLAQ